MPVLLPARALVLTGCLLGLVGTCGPAAFGQGPLPGASPPARGTYEFGQPDATFELSSALREISGITVLNDSLLGAVEDESGVLFVLDLRNGTIVAEHSFGPPGDYEGLASNGPRVFVLSSDGTLTLIDDWRAAALEVRTLDPGLADGNDMEGLAYDAARHRLLLVCKTCPGDTEHRQKFIYAFDLATETLAPEPVLTIEAEAYMDAANEPWINRKIRAIIDPLFDLSGLKPSGLAIHPQTGELLVLSSGRRSLAVVGPDGSIHAVWSLPSKLFGQPEGVTALPNGDLFISNEGNVGRATLVRFNRRTAEDP